MEEKKRIKMSDEEFLNTLIGNQYEDLTYDEKTQTFHFKAPSYVESANNLTGVHRFGPYEDYYVEYEISFLINDLVDFIKSDVAIRFKEGLNTIFKRFGMKEQK